MKVAITDIGKNIIKRMTFSWRLQMKKILSTVALLNLAAGIIALILRINIEYVTQMHLVDLLFFAGAFFWIIGGASLIGDQKYKSSRLADLTPDYAQENKRYYFVFVMFLTGLPSIVAGLIMAFKG
jgi:hypothetical protein